MKLIISICLKDHGQVGEQYRKITFKILKLKNRYGKEVGI